MTRLRPASDGAPASWVQAGIRGFGESVLSLVPDGFPAYVRSFHLARGETWAEIAARQGTVVHPRMQFPSIARTASLQAAPMPGHLPPEAIAPLSEILTRNTSTPDACWFAVWEGWGANAQRADIVRAPTFTLPNRRYHLMCGPVSAAVESVEDAPFSRSPSLWWPDDRAWLVATEVDLHSTYVGCSELCADVIVSDQRLEALPIEPTAGISFASDDVNG
jgi:hypothetical protein